MHPDRDSARVRGFRHGWQTSVSAEPRTTEAQVLDEALPARLGCGTQSPNRRTPSRGPQDLLALRSPARVDQHAHLRLALLLRAT